MNEDEALKRITKLLEEGCTMLATHHDCGAPLFRCKGEVVCPVCSFEASNVPCDDDAEQQQISPSTKEAISKDMLLSLDDKSINEKNFKPDILKNDELERIKISLIESILCKLEAFTDGLEKEQDLDKLLKQLDCIEKMLEILRFAQR